MVRLIAAATDQQTLSSIGRKNLPGIGLKPDLSFAVPGTTVTYYFDKGDDLAPNHFYQYRWEILDILPRP